MTELISNLLDMIRVRGTAYYSKSLRVPWSMNVEQHDDLCRFHLVLAGSAWIGLSGLNSTELLEEGDFVIVPRGQGHYLGDIPDRKDGPSHSIPGELFQPEFQQFKNASRQTLLLCGYFQFAQGMPSILTSQLPDLLITHKNVASRSAQIGQIADLLRDELGRNDQPHTVILNRLTEVLFYHAIRQWLDGAVLPGGALQALADIKLQRVFEEIHQNPAQPWTVDSLAKVAGQSRTVFAAHFKQATGISPISYLGHWRTELACKLLVESEYGIDQIALESGYRDTTAFSRAFKKTTGSSPGNYRRSRKN